MFGLRKRNYVQQYPLIRECLLVGAAVEHKVQNEPTLSVTPALNPRRASPGVPGRVMSVVYR